MALVESRSILGYRLEAVMETPERGVAIRREMLSGKLANQRALDNLPYRDYDYSKVLLHSRLCAPPRVWIRSFMLAFFIFR